MKKSLVALGLIFSSVAFGADTSKVLPPQSLGDFDSLKPGLVLRFKKVFYLHKIKTPKRLLSLWLNPDGEYSAYDFTDISYRTSNDGTKIQELLRCSLILKTDALDKKNEYVIAAGTELPIVEVIPITFSGQTPIWKFKHPTFKQFSCSGSFQRYRDQDDPNGYPKGGVMFWGPSTASALEMLDNAAEIINPAAIASAGSKEMGPQIECVGNTSQDFKKILIFYTDDHTVKVGETKEIDSLLYVEHSLVWSPALFFGKHKLTRTGMLSRMYEGELVWGSLGNTKLNYKLLVDGYTGILTEVYFTLGGVTTKSDLSCHEFVNPE